MPKDLSLITVAWGLFGGVVLFLMKSGVNGIFTIKKDLQSIKENDLQNIKESIVEIKVSGEYQGREIKDIKKRLNNFEGVCSRQHGRPVHLMEIDGT